MNYQIPPLQIPDDPIIRYVIAAPIFGFAIYVAQSLVRVQIKIRKANKELVLEDSLDGQIDILEKLHDDIIDMRFLFSLYKNAKLDSLSDKIDSMRTELGTLEL